jgi:hypothetical protein
MRLSAMQDIGGCRAVLQTVAQVKRVHAGYLTSAAKHELKGQKDYVTAPKSSGYRSVHLVYQYQSERHPEYNGRSIEIQLRSRLQHAWATAVETVGTFLQQSLKSSLGSEEWLRYFALAGSAFALDEKTTLVPGTPTSATQLFREINEAARELGVEKKLRTYGAALKVTQDPALRGASYFLLVLKPAEGRLQVRGYFAGQLAQATRQYLEEEKQLAENPGTEVVLVSVDSLQALRRAYPNYFLDTEVFFRELARILARQPEPRL